MPIPLLPNTLRGDIKASAKPETAAISILPNRIEVKRDKTAVNTSTIKRQPISNGIPARIVDRAKEFVNDPAMFLKHMRESGDLKDHLDDFYNPDKYEDYKKHEANAKYVNEHYPYPFRFLAKQMSRTIACRERNKDKDNPKWRQDNKRCD